MSDPKDPCSDPLVTFSSLRFTLELWPDLAGEGLVINIFFSPLEIWIKTKARFTAVTLIEILSSKKRHMGKIFLVITTWCGMGQGRNIGN